MQTNLADFIRNTPAGREAEAILRKCVHCGFCTATCPTYQLLGDELDGPRGRIYLMKQVLEGAAPTARTQLHLDRCLTCRACETTCPSGVEYHRLVDIGREVVSSRVARPAGQRFLRFALREFLSRGWLFGPAYQLGQFFRPLLPASLRAKVLAAQKSVPATRRDHPRRMLMLAGCVQPSMSPNINAAAARVLDRLGIAAIEADGAGCCGAVRMHLDDHEGARHDARRNIDAWWPHIEAGAEGIIITASGCGAHVLEYAHLLEGDPAYAAKAARVSALTRDLGELLPDLAAQLAGRIDATRAAAGTVAYHAPCTLQHGQRLRGTVEQHLRALGFDVRAPLCEAHLCCGSAGTYSMLQPRLAQELRDRKLGHLSDLAPERIVSANVGCITHLQSGTTTPVSHWIELLDQALLPAAAEAG